MALSTKNILIVEDENIVAKNLQMLLVRMGYRVVGISAYGEDLLPLADEHFPDVILIDIGLRGDIDGIEAARRLHEVLDIPVIFLTANSDLATLERSKIAQPYGYILKPFDERDIQSTIEMAVSRHKADRELSESKLWLAITLQSIGDAVIATDENGLVKFMNPIAERLTGWTQAEAVGMPLPNVFRIINQSSRLIVENPVEIVLQKGYIVGIANHTVLVAKNGIEYNIDDAAAPILDHKGAVSGVVLTFRDITEKYKIEAAIEANERRFRALIEHNQDMIRMINATGDVVYISPSATRITGYTPEEFSGQRMLEIIHPDDIQEAKEKLDAALRLPGIPIQVQHKIRHKQGHWLWVEGTVINLLNDPDVRAIVSNIRDITDRKNAEEEQLQSEKNLRETVEAITVPMVVTSMQTGKILYGNQLVADLMGVPIEAIGQHEAMEFYSNTDDRLAFIAAIEKHGFVQNFTTQMRRYSGEIIWVLLAARRVIFNAQQALAVTLYDITEKKTAEEALKVSTSRLQGIIESAMDAIITTDSSLNIILFNKAAEIVFRCSEKEVLGTTIDQFIPKRFRASHEGSILAFEKEGVTNRAMGSLGLLTGLRYDGEEFPIEASISQTNSPTGKLFTVILRDLTDLQQSEKQIRDQAALMDLVPDAIIMRNYHHEIISWSKGAEQIYGWTAAEAIGKNAPDLFGISNAPEFLEAKKILHETGEWSGELRHRTKNGAIIIVHSSLKMLYNTANEPNAILVTNTNITEKKSLEMQLFRAQRLESIGTLASGIAHDLNNILTPVVLGMELIKLTALDDSTRKRIDTIISTVQRGSGLIGQVLSFARGSQEERQAINIKYIVDEVAKIARETFPKGIEVALNLASDELIVNGNATQIHQVLMNLCINARDAMSDRGGMLSVEAGYITATESLLSRFLDAKPGEYVRITVSDTGIGIPPELQDRVFEPFYTTKEVGKGTGIGLTTVFAIVRNHSGFIELLSEVGIGTTFTIYLPAEKRPQMSNNLPSTEFQYDSLGTTILLVDDEDLIRNIAEDILQAYGYNVITAHNGAEALEAYIKYQHTINAVITDVMMPVMGGLELIGILKEMNPEIRIIAASGVMHSDSAKNLNGAGAKVILHKPFTVENLLDAIKEVLQ